MKTAKVGSSTTTYVYNALGQRIKKSGGSAGTVLYAYDESGRLIGEYSSAGALVQETIWLEDTPVATIRPGTPAIVYYVHADQLNAPRMVTRPSDNKIAWRWDTDPFGTSAPNENPQSLGTFKYNQRFPGQMFDSETSINYNYFRDYDAVVGRYVESDPVGLKGGVNTYSYAKSGPSMRIDPTGLYDAPAVDEPWPETDTVSILCKALHPDAEEYACDNRCQCVSLAKQALCGPGNLRCLEIVRNKQYGCKLKCATGFCPASPPTRYANNWDGIFGRFL